MARSHSGLADLLAALVCCALFERATRPQRQMLVVPAAALRAVLVPAAASRAVLVPAGYAAGAAVPPGDALPLIACATMERDGSAATRGGSVGT